LCQGTVFNLSRGLDEFFLMAFSDFTEFSALGRDLPRSHADHHFFNSSRFTLGTHMHALRLRFTLAAGVLEAGFLAAGFAWLWLLLRQSV
jgi:hypothetical protein